MKKRGFWLGLGSLGQGWWVAWTQLLFFAAPPLSFGSSSAWTVLSVQDTGISPENFGVAISADGEIYTSNYTACAAPTLKVGDSSQGSSCVTKTDTSGHSVFAVQIGGVGVTAFALDAAGNAYVAGASVPGGLGFVTTPGAYESTAPSPNLTSPFVCKLSGNDGHPLFCTYADVYPLNLPVVDSTGATYLAGDCSSFTGFVCVEKINPAGTAAPYLSHTALSRIPLVFPQAAVDTQGNLFLAQPNGLVKLNPSGVITASDALQYSQLIGLAVDPEGEPQITATLQPGQGYANVLVLRYKADLSTILFDVPLFLPGSVSGIAVDAAGITNLWGTTSNVNLAPVHPTAVCSPGSNAFLTRLDDSGTTLQSTFLNGPASFLAGAPMVFNSGSAYLLSVDTGLIKILNLGPAPSEVALSCIGSGASFSNAPLAPNQIVSLFGYGIGPSVPLLGQPDSNGLYPFQLGGTQVTFDGVAAPVLYVSGGQVNLVTPRSLQGTTATHVCAVSNNVATNCLAVPVQPAAPGLFVLPGNHAAAINQDGKINSAQDVAPTGSIVSLFLTGLGTTTPATPDGSITPYPGPVQDLKISAIFTWEEYCFLYATSESAVADPLYVGPAPLEIEGLGQINVVVPSLPGPGPYGPPCYSKPVYIQGGPSVAIEVFPPGGGPPIVSPAVGISTP